MPKKRPVEISKITPYFSPGVLIGNWVEDSFECPEDPCLTLYCPKEEVIDYEKMKPELRQGDLRMNKLVGKDGHVPLVMKHDSHLHCKDFATVNDLVYNHLPKPLCGPILRRYRKSENTYVPQPDLMKCFGNVTEWGLRSNKLLEWACTDVSDYAASLYDDSYIPPKLWQYLPAKERKARSSSFTKEFRYKMTKPVPPRPKRQQPA